MANGSASTVMLERSRSSVPDRATAEPKIVHQDDHLFVVLKPPGLPTTSPDASEPCLVRWVKSQLPLHKAVHATSRLDGPVSGLVTFALTSPANQHLLEARRAGKYERTYLGITTRDVSFTDREWTWPISIDPSNRKRRIAGPGKGEREALTRCELAARRDCAALLRFKPATGRTHQIRVHAAKGGVPLFGDHAYGGDRRITLSGGSVVTARRVMLHCARVRFPKVTGDGLTELTAAPPADMTGVWVELGGDPCDLRVGL